MADRDEADGDEVDDDDEADDVADGVNAEGNDEAGDNEVEGDNEVDVVFEGPVGWTENPTKTGPNRTGGCSCPVWAPVQLPVALT